MLAPRDRISLFQGLDRDVALHLLEGTADTSGIVTGATEVRK